MSTYGYSHYGPPTLYGPDRPITVVPGGGALPPISNAYLIDPMVATAVDYKSILVTWTAPDTSTDTPMTEFRLISNRYGFPVDENDGNILIDSAHAPGTSYLDQNVVPGQMTYYGFYISTGTTWVRSGFAACLMPKNYGYASSLLSYLPAYLRDIETNELTADAAGNPYLFQFLQVAGFGLDYLKTQYDFLFGNQNAPMRMSFSDLADLAGQIGMPFSAEIPSYYLRKAVDNWATVMRQRGTLAGIAEHISLLSGYGADIQLARNIMLENDQSAPVDPVFAPWSASIPYGAVENVRYPVYPQWVISGAYVANNYVQYLGVNYQCTAPVSGVPPTGAPNSGSYWAIAAGPYIWEASAAVTSLPGSPPGVISGPGTLPTANSGWNLVYDVAWAGQFLAIPNQVGGLNTWEVLTASGATPNAAGVPAGNLLIGAGIRNPSNWANDFSHSSFRVQNRGGAVTDQWFRSVSRQASDITAGLTVPDPQLVVEHGIPVPPTGDAWNAGTRYATGSVVSYDGLNYLALRASKGAAPPQPAVPLNANWDFETGAWPWSAFGTGAAVTQSSAFAYHGTSSLLLTFPASTSYPGIASENVPVIPGANYTVSAYVYMTGAATPVQAGIAWLDIFGNRIGGASFYFGNQLTPALSTWTQVSGQCQAPVNAATAAITYMLPGTTPASVVSAYFDLVELTCTATPEWVPLGLDGRIPLVISAETSQNWSVSSVEQYAITPFVEWYDNWGNLITRAFARTPTAGTAGTPNSYTYDSFTTGPNTPLQGRETDTQDQAWLVPTGDWKVSGNGYVFPPSGSRNLAWVTGPANTSISVTLGTAPPSPQEQAIMFRASSTSNYWKATATKLVKCVAGAFTTVATYPTAAKPGDRLTVQANGSSITVLLNGATAATATDSFNSSATNHGILVE